MIKPFHLSFVVPNLASAKSFYLDILGCSLGRDSGGWIDIIFFGHQLTIHQENEFVSAKALDHFGPILGKEEWLSVAEKCSQHGVTFEMKPTLKDEGTPLEAGKYLLKDPAGNLLEFKYYSRFDATVEGKQV